MKVRYCKGCKRDVVAVKKKINWWLVVLGISTAGVLSIVYLLYHYILKRRTRCSCGMRVISRKKAEKLGYYDKPSPTVVIINKESGESYGN
jgi:hypothetical protein